MFVAGVRDEDILAVTSLGSFSNQVLRHSTASTDGEHPSCVGLELILDTVEELGCISD